MQRCLELAQRAKGYTTPNPMVGAVLVARGLIIGEGWHKRYGGDHAEVDCLDSVSSSNRHLIPGSTMYVNLEPCAHRGKTPPCANRLVQERIGIVVIANRDPFSKVDGRGIAILKEAGIEVVTGVLEKEGLWVNRRFFCAHTLNRPYIILKWAQTADGYIAPADGSRFRISNEHCQQLLHRWRTEEGAIMAGTNTAIIDNPQLNARLWDGPQPLRIILDRQLTVPAAHHIFDRSIPTWIINEVRDTRSGSPEYLKIDFGNRLLDSILELLSGKGILSLIVEGGAMLLNSFLKKDLWDEARVFTGNVTLGTGIAAPLPVNGTAACSAMQGSDALRVFVNKKSKYQYVADTGL